MKTKSTHANTKVVAREKGYSKLNKKMTSSDVSVSMPHVPSMKGRSSAGNSTYKNQA